MISVMIAARRFALHVSVFTILMVFSATFSLANLSMDYFHLPVNALYIFVAGLIAVLEIGGIVQRRKWMEFGSLGAGAAPVVAVNKVSEMELIRKSGD